MLQGYGNLQRLYEDWRKAEEPASAAERSVMDAVVRAIETQGEPPDVQAWEQARSLREMADAASRRMREERRGQAAHP